MNNFIKGILTIGVLIPVSLPAVQASSINDSWKDVAQDFFEAGNDIRESIDEQKLHTSN